MQSLCNSGCVGCAGSVEEKCALVKREREKKNEGNANYEWNLHGKF